MASKGIYPATVRAFVGGNYNNDLKAGSFYVNLNNDASNSNSNNGAALSYSKIFLKVVMRLSQCRVLSSPLGEN